MSGRLLHAVFVANATVLCVHQIDAAYWHEWELFHIPGGNQVNLLLNLPIVASVFWAYAQVATRSIRYTASHYYLAFLGFLTVSLHSVFYGLGAEEFQQPVSVALITATAILSAIQVVLTRRI